MILFSILDSDFYKFTMQQAVLRHFPDVRVRYRFIDRSENIYPRGFADRLREEIDRWPETLVLSKEELDWLRSLDMFSESYLSYLREYRFNPGEVAVDRRDDGALILEIEGLWARTILWEVPLLALISESYHRLADPDRDMRTLEAQVRERTRRKAVSLLQDGCRFSDFGTRRRYSRQAQQWVLESCQTEADRPGRGSWLGRFAGTSNMDLARRLGLAPMGTIAHEWFMAHGALSGVLQANKDAMLRWLQVYPSAYSIALADTYTTDLFLDNFDRVLAEGFNGVRQDSGDPFAFVDRFLMFYNALDIPTEDKTLVFSDGLDEHKAADIETYAGRHFQTAYGIGTYLTNDVPDSRPLDIIIKLVEVNGFPVCKLTDDPEKAVGEPGRVEEVRNLVKRYLKAEGILSPS